MTVPTPPPIASVVVPHYEDPHGLERLLTALELQRLDGTFEVIVADDGSLTPPAPGPRPFPLRVVGHADLGNRAGSARNLGAAAATGEVLVFIDGDMVPEPDGLAELLSVCDERHLTVGRRRHADLGGLGGDRIRRWLAGEEPGPEPLPEPAWLRDGYAATDDLRNADLRSYRFVISALLACPRDAFLRLGGFAEELVGYGGEDWELARRAWLAGVDLRYAPRAVGWHDGPDLAGRPTDLRALKNCETLRIAPLITDPLLRGRGLIWDHPRVVVRCAPRASDPVEAWIACAEGLLRTGDVGIWTGDGPGWPVTDPRVRRGLPPRSSLGRAELIVDLRAPVRIDAATLDGWEQDAPIRAGRDLQVVSPRDLALGTPPTEIAPPAPLPADVQLEAWFGRNVQPCP